MKSQPTSTSFQESAALPLPPPAAAFAQSASARSTPTPPPSSKSTGHPSAITGTSETSQDGAATLISLQQAFLANLSALQGRGVELAMKDTYGQFCAEPLAKFAPSGACLKMCQDSCQTMLDGSLEEFSGTWPRSGMMLCGTVFQLPPLVRITRETDCGLLPTLVAQEGGSNKSPGPNAKIRPTITTMARRGLLPTLTARDWKNSIGSNVGRHTQTLVHQVYKISGIRGPLNPAWAEAFMGYPIGQTELNASETPSSRKSRKSSSKKSGN